MRHLEQTENFSSILQSASQRAAHFSQALQWYSMELQNNALYAQGFARFADELVSCARTNHTGKQAFFIAVGKSAQVAQLVVSMLMSVGILARFIHPTEAYHGDLGVVGSQDCVFFLSNNGQSSELIQLVPGLLERKVNLFALTARLDSPLARSCQETLQIPPFSENCPLSQAPITSPITMLAFFQLLVAASIEMRNFPLEEYAKNHPGGAIGKRIFLKVSDLMIKGTALPCVHLESPFHEVISTITTFSKGAALVLQNKKFCGLIAERDLRKAMETLGARVFESRALEIMNAKPTVIKADLLAIEAFKIMQAHNPPFNLLPVLDDQGNGVGMIRVLDLMEAGFSTSL